MLGLSVGIRAGIDEGSDHRRVLILARREVQRSPPAPRSAIGVGALVKQAGDDRGVFVASREVQEGRTLLTPDV